MKTRTVSLPIITDGVSDRPILYFIEDSKGASLTGTHLDWHCSAGKWSFIVPKNTFSNFISVPALIRSIIRFFISPIDPVIVIPSIAHDYLVTEWAPTDFVPVDTGDANTPVYVTWKEAARIFPDYADAHYTGTTAYLKSRLVYGLVLAYGLVTGKLNKRVGMYVTR